MSTTYAKHPDVKPQPKAALRVRDVAHAREIYLKSTARVDLAKLGKIFETAPDDVEFSGRHPRTK